MSIYKRKNNRYSVQVDGHAGSDGKRQRRTLGSYKTKKEAQRVEREALIAIERGIDLAPGVISVAQLLERFIADREALGRGAKTIEEYRRMATLYVAPHLGSVGVAKLRPAMVSAWITKLMQSGGYGGRPISAKTARHAFALLSSALRWGVRLELAGRNVCESVDAPKPPRSEAKAHSDEERAALCAASIGTRWQHFITLAFASGARRGELLALSWKHVDLDSSAPSMTIAGSLSQTCGRVFVKTTKSDRVRVVPLSVAMVAAFRAQRLMQATDRLRLGDAYVTDLASAAAPVFTDELGERQTPKSATNAVARLAKIAGVPITSLHALRHTAATLLIGSGADVRTAAAILGHANAGVTLNVYSHVVAGAERSAIELLGSRLERAPATGS